MGGSFLKRNLPWCCICFTLSLVFSGCLEAPVPAEADLAEKIDRELAGAGASFLLTEEYCRWQAGLFLARAHMEKERDRIWPFRDMDRVKAEYSALVQGGTVLAQRVAEARAARERAISQSFSEWKERISDLKRVTTLMNEGRLARSHLIQAELLLEEAERCLARGDHGRVELLLTQVALHGRRGDSALEPILSRYSDRSQIDRWRNWVRDTLEESDRDGGLAVVVFKLEKRMVLYRAGKPFRTYTVGLGANGLSDKRRSGDDATPEGRYRITRKNPRSHFHKALLIDYPNDEDRRQFALAKRRGAIPAGAGIGGLVEIHGGGVGSMTFGCISLDDRMIDELYDLVDIGTPVTIVGTVERGNPLASAEVGRGGV